MKNMVFVRRWIFYFLSLIPIPVIAADLNEQAFSVLKSRCATCHACYDAPCQLKLSTPEGLFRGASKLSVYDVSRLESISPTRLYIDANSPVEWQEKGFFPILHQDRLNDSWYCDNCLLSRLLIQKQEAAPLITQPLPEDFPLDINRALSCPQPSELNTFIEQHPTFGMPYGMAALPDEDYEILQAWLAQDEITLPVITPQVDSQTQSLVYQWEEFLNQDSLENQLLARYLYEHWFIAHIRFIENNPVLFRIVRSRTQAPEAIEEIATRHPTDDPREQFYYRFKVLEEVLLDKTHIPLSLNGEKLTEILQLFFSSPWSVDTLPAYPENEAVNPFTTYQAIPPRARYQFLLNDARFFIESFIKGLVCRGQVALNVINDHFFVSFLDPDFDLSVNEEDYLIEAAPMLQLPGNVPSLLDFDDFWIDRLQHHLHYLAFRNERYQESGLTSSGLGLNAVWPGENEERPGGLTIFRHFDSATILPGFHGQVPKSTWIIDYPIFERIYYSLVANYDVFSNLGHQILTRIYMDYLRMESETLFVSLLPIQDREPLLESWYQGAVARAKMFWTHSGGTLNLPSNVDFESSDSYSELLTNLARSLNLPTNNSPDSRYTQLDGLKASENSWINQMPDVVYLITIKDNQDITGINTIFRNKAHSNISFIFSEDSRRLPEQDSITVLSGSQGSYPNFIFLIPENDVAGFISELTGINDSSSMKTLVDHYGIRRTDPRIWSTLDSLHSYRTLEEGKPQYLDMNRYDNL
tara:strand:+ start:8183 stop:10444 length:2262 start_codon:yes stop_codon:yes gene_type:complete